MDENSAIPAYLTAHEFSDDETWDQIAWRFGEFCDVLEQIRFETKDEAIGVPRSTKNGRVLESTLKPWIDPEAGVFVRPWLLAAFDPKRDVDEWEERRRIALEMRDRIGASIQRREATVPFVAAWGAFCEIGALFEQAWYSPSGSHAQMKAGARQGVQEQKRWYSHLYVSLERGRKRNDVDGDIVIFVEQILKNSVLPDARFNSFWYKAILPGEGAKATLASSFNINKLPRKKGPKTAGNSIEELAATPRDDLPPIDAASYHR